MMSFAPPWVSVALPSTSRWRRRWLALKTAAAPGATWTPSASAQRAGVVRERERAGDDVQLILTRAAVERDRLRDRPGEFQRVIAARPVQDDRVERVEIERQRRRALRDVEVVAVGEQLDDVPGGEEVDVQRRGDEVRERGDELERPDRAGRPEIAREVGDAVGILRDRCTSRCRQSSTSRRARRCGRSRRGWRCCPAGRDRSALRCSSCCPGR